MMIINKTAIASALALALGAGVAQAEPVVSWDLQDCDNDSLQSDFNFNNPAPGDGPNIFGAAGETGCTNAADGDTCDAVAFDAGPIDTNVFTTGFNFGGTGVFAPNVTDGAGGGTMTADITGGVLTFTALDFGGIFGGVQFILPPDDINSVDTGTPTDLGNGDWCVIVEYVGTIDEPSSPFNGFPANWRLEGVMSTGGVGPATTVTASVLPSSRSVEVGTPATAFATIINSGTADATGCGIAPTTVVDAAFQYQTTDASNALTGSVNTPADIPAGGQQNYVFGFTPNSAFDPTNVEFEFDCAETDPASVVAGLNTLLLSASAAPIADIVALAATLNNDGYVDIPGDTGTGVLAVAAVNVGAADTITASSAPSTGLPVTVSLCETDAAGACVAAPAPTVTTSIANGATPSFAAFVTGTAAVADDPAANRITIQFEDSGAVVRGATSVAVRTVTQ